ncbi:MAG: PspC domain-containing protein [Bacteroidales bacterium]|nr:PspC domain-containing protein [Bacteroidales bacterium]
MERRLYRSSRNKKLFGVCGGIAEYMDADPTVVRLVFVLGTLLLVGGGLLLYLIAALVMPTERQIND